MAHRGSYPTLSAGCLRNTGCLIKKRSNLIFQVGEAWPSPCHNLSDRVPVMGCHPCSSSETEFTKLPCDFLLPQGHNPLQSSRSWLVTLNAPSQCGKQPHVITGTAGGFPVFKSSLASLVVSSSTVNVLATHQPPALSVLFAAY